MGDGPPFLVYRELIPSTSITFATFFHWSCTDFDLKSKFHTRDFLLTVTTSSVSIHQIHYPVDDSDQYPNLALCCQFTLYGKPQDVCTFRKEFDSQDSIQYILITLDVGKFLVLEFNPWLCMLSPRRMLNAEENAFGIGSEVTAKTSGRSINLASLSEPLLIIDDRQTVACTLLYSNQLFVLPLRSLLSSSGSADQIQSQFIVELHGKLQLLGSVIDFRFVRGYARPTIAILQEAAPLPIGHAARVLHTCTITVLTIDVVTKSASILWQRSKLPHDSVRLINISNNLLPGVIGLVSMNAFLIVGQQVVKGIATNGLASTTVHPSIRLQPWPLIDAAELDASRWIEADSHTLVGALKDGRLLAVHLLLPSGDGIAEETNTQIVMNLLEIDVDFIATSIRSSCFCSLAHRSASGTVEALWFLGSRVSDSLLLSVKMSPPPAGGIMSRSGIGGTGGNADGWTPSLASVGAGVTPAAKKARRSPRSAMEKERGLEPYQSDIAAEEAQLFGRSLGPAGGGKGAAAAGHSVTWSSSLHSTSSFGLSSSSLGHGRLFDIVVADCVSVMGPIVTGLFTTPDDFGEQNDSLDWQPGRPRPPLPASAAAYIQAKEAKDSLLVSAGLDDQSALARISYGLRLSKLATREFASATCVLSLQAPSKLFTLVFVTVAGKTRLLQTTSAGREMGPPTAAAAAERSAAALGSVAAATKQVQLADFSMKEHVATDAGFIGAEPTVAVGVLHAATEVIVQVYASGLRVTRLAESVAAAEPLQDVLMSESVDAGGIGGEAGESIVAADVMNGWVVMLTTSRSVHLLQYSPDEEILSLAHSATPLAAAAALATKDPFFGASLASASAAAMSLRDPSSMVVATPNSQQQDIPAPTSANSSAEDSCALRAEPSLAQYLTDTIMSVTFFQGRFPTTAAVTAAAAGSGVDAHGSAWEMAPPLRKANTATAAGGAASILAPGGVSGGVLGSPRADRTPTAQLSHRGQSKVKFSPNPLSTSGPAGALGIVAKSAVARGKMSPRATEVKGADGRRSTSAGENAESSPVAEDADADADVAGTRDGAVAMGEEEDEGDGMEEMLLWERVTLEQRRAEEKYLYSSPLPDCGESNNDDITAGVEAAGPAKGPATGPVAGTAGARGGGAALLTAGGAGLTTPTHKRGRNMAVDTNMVVDTNTAEDEVADPAQGANSQLEGAAGGGGGQREDDCAEEAAQVMGEDVDGDENGDDLCLYLLIGNALGAVELIRVADLKRVFSAKDLRLAPDFIPLLAPTATQTDGVSDGGGEADGGKRGQGLFFSTSGAAGVVGHPAGGPARDFGSSSLLQPESPHGGSVATPTTPTASSPRAGATADGGGNGAVIKTADRLMCDVRLARIGVAAAGVEKGVDDTSLSQSRLCLVATFDSGDVVVYYTTECDGAAVAFKRLEHSVVTHRPRSKQARLRRSSSFDSTDGIAGGVGTDSRQQQYQGDGGGGGSGGGGGGDGGDSGDSSVSAEAAASLQLRCAVDWNTYQLSVIECVHQGSNGILIPGPRPTVLLAHKGYPVLAPLGFPELPFSNAGAFSLCQLQVGPICGVLTLWQEQEGNMSRKVFGMYQLVPGATVFAGGLATVRKVKTQTTVHFCTEIQPKTDEESEKALLRKKTFLMACSQEVEEPFLESVMTEEEIAREAEQYDRFYPELTSFCRPDLKTGPAPKQVTRSYKLVLVQGAKVVDVYQMPDGEQITGIEVLYVETEKKQDAIATFTSALAGKPPPPPIKRRVFVSASTLSIDKHGEDSQGEGRLLVFALDYKQFESDEALPAAGAAAASGDGADDDGDVDGESGARLVKVDGVHNSASLSSGAVGAHVVVGGGSSSGGGSGSGVGGGSGGSSVGAVVSGFAVNGIQVTVTGGLAIAEAIAAAAAAATAAAAAAQSAAQAQFFDSILPKLLLHWQGPGPACIVKQFGDSCILSTIGAHVFVYRMNRESLELEQAGFYFAQFFISSVTVIKNYILLADVGNSVTLLVWRGEDCSLTEIAKDFDNHVCLSSAVVLDKPSMGFIVSDNEANLQLMQFNPRRVESKKGSRLLSLAEFHLGSDANVLLSHTLLTPPPPPPSTAPVQPKPHGRGGKGARSGQALIPFGTTLDKQTGGRSCVIVGTIDGSLGVLIPMDEKMYRRLMLLQQLMCMGVETPCRLSPSDYRAMKTTRFRLERKKGVLDGTLLWKYPSLSATLQAELAAVMGSSPDIILENLSRLDALVAFF